MISSERALILAPSGRDGQLASGLLGEIGVSAQICLSLVDLVDGLRRGAGVSLLTEEALLHADLTPLLDWVADQPAWSDFPFVVLTRRNDRSAPSPAVAALQDRLGNVIFLDRPFHPEALSNVIGNALRGRRRQYQARQYLLDVREGEQRLQTALLAGRMGAWELDVVELALTGSDQFRACFGRAGDDVLLFADLIESVVLADQRRVQRAFDDAMAGADLVLEFRVRWPDGSEHWVDLRARIVSDRHGRPLALVGVCSDISARKAAEVERERLLAAVAAERERTQQALREERALSGLLLTSVPAGIVAYDAEMRVTIWNPVMERIFGLPAPAVLGRPLARIIGDGQEDRIEQRLRNALIGLSDPMEEIELDTIANGAVVLESQHAPLRGGDGQIVGGAAFFREVTDRRRAEDQLRQAQKMETIGQLTGGVAHDFNNLLAAIQGNLELLRKRLPDDPQIQRFFDGAFKGAQRGASLTSRLLAFARRQDLRPEPADLSALLEGMRGLMERSIGPLVEMNFSIAPDLPPAKVDANQLELAILNLAVNARDAMPDGGRLTVTLDQRDDDPELVGHYLCLSISDTGTGMDAETLKSAIEPFFSTKELGKGTGLGLSMVHGLAVQLGGALRLKSQFGEGTTAELWLPASSAPVVETVEMSVEPSVAPQASTILVVDDDALINMNTVDMVEDLGHTALEAYSGKQALEILAGNAGIALLITDYAMPGMTGVELAERARELRPDLPVLLATGYADLPTGTTTDLPRLAKPYQQVDLAKQISRLLAAG